jgi:hypothetical protein
MLRHDLAWGWIWALPFAACGGSFDSAGTTSATTGATGSGGSSSATGATSTASSGTATATTAATTSTGMGGGGTGGQGGSLPVACGGLGVLGDDFEDGVLPREFSYLNQAGKGVVEQEGKLVFDMTGTGYVQAQGTHWYRFKDSGVRLEVVDAAQSAVPRPRFLFQVSISSADYFQLQIDNELTATAVIANVYKPLANVPYNAVNHRWLQIRETGGNVLLEASHDGKTWSALGTVPSSQVPDLVAAKVNLTVSTPQAQLSSGTRVKIDNLNGGTKTEAYCKSSTFSDDFADGTHLPFWKDVGGFGDCMRTENGQLTFTYPGNQNAACVLDSSNAFDLTGDRVSLRFGDNTLSQPLAAWMQVRRDGENFLQIRRLGSEVSFRQRVKGVTGTLTTFPYDPVQHKWLGVSESGGMVSFGTSADGKSFTPKYTGAVPFPLDSLDIVIANDSVPQGISGVVTYDDLNRAP